MSVFGDDRPITIERKVLEAARLAVTIRTPLELSVSPAFDPHGFGEELAWRLSSCVARDQLAPERYSEFLTTRRPASTWQMFKHSNRGTWWLGWLVRRRPVVEVLEHHTLTVEVDRAIYYPDLIVKEAGRPLIVESLRKVS